MVANTLEARNIPEQNQVWRSKVQSMLRLCQDVKPFKYDIFTAQYGITSYRGELTLVDRKNNLFNLGLRFEVQDSAYPRGYALLTLPNDQSREGDTDFTRKNIIVDHHSFMGRDLTKVTLEAETESDLHNAVNFTLTIGSKGMFIAHNLNGSQLENIPVTSESLSRFDDGIRALEIGIKRMRGAAALRRT